MSKRGAVSELNKEIERLTGIRDSLLPVESQSITRVSGGLSGKLLGKRSSVTKKATSAKRAPSTKKSGTAKKSASAKQVPPSAKRVVSDAARKKMSDAAKARSAATKTP